MSGSHHIGLSEIQYLGPLFWGFTVATGLCGMSVVQANTYFTENKDSWRMRSLMLSLLFFDIVGTSLVANATYSFLVIDFDKPPSNGIVIPMPYCVEYIFAKLIIFASQMFYARRIYIVARECRILPVIVVFTSFAAFGVGIAQFALLTNMRTNFFTLWDNRYQVICGLNIFLTAFSDIVATGSMIRFLASQEPEYERTRRVLSKLLFYAKKRGLLVTVFQIGTGVAFFAGTNKTYWIPFHLIVSKLHVTTLFSMLNCRATLRRSVDEITGISAVNSSWSTRNLEAMAKTSSGHMLPPLDLPAKKCPKARELVSEIAFASGPSETSLSVTTDEGAHERSMSGQ